jgi:hypothetical protein
LGRAQGDAIVFRQKLKINDAPEVVALKCALALEELARQRYELPGFSTLLKIARAARSRVNREYQAGLLETLDASAKEKLFGNRQIRPLPFFVVTIFTFGLAGKFASKVVSVISILRCNSSTNWRALTGCPSAE